jgi:hypothetical protein
MNFSIDLSEYSSIEELVEDFTARLGAYCSMQLGVDTRIGKAGFVALKEAAKKFRKLDKEIQGGGETSPSEVRSFLLESTENFAKAVHQILEKNRGKLKSFGSKVFISEIFDEMRQYLSREEFNALLREANIGRLVECSHADLVEDMDSNLVERSFVPTYPGAAPTHGFHFVQS